MRTAVLGDILHLQPDYFVRSWNTWVGPNGKDTDVWGTLSAADWEYYIQQLCHELVGTPSAFP